MADDKSKLGPQDRARVDGGEDYKVGGIIVAIIFGFLPSRLGLFSSLPHVLALKRAASSEPRVASPAL